MKVALLLPGLSRSADRCYPDLKKYLLSLYDVDTYIHTYEQTEIGSENSKKVDYSLSKEDLVKIYNPKKIVVENYDDIKDFFLEKSRNYSKIDCNAERVISSFYKIQQCFELVEEEYDFYIRSRMDLVHETPIILSNLDNFAINIPLPTNKKTRFENGYYYSYSPDYKNEWIMDHFSIGNFQNMKNYCSVFTHLDNLCIKRNLMLHPEFLTKQNLNYTNTKIHRFFAEYSLHRRSF